MGSKERQHASEVLLGLKLRAVMACGARAAERVEPIIAAELEEKAVDSCRNAVDMAWSFAAGELGSPYQVRRVAAEAGAFLFNSLPSERVRHAFAAIQQTAVAAKSAYDAIESHPLDRHECYVARERVQDALANASWVGGDDIDAAIARDLRQLSRTHNGEVTTLGAAFDAGSTGPLGPLWHNDEKLPGAPSSIKPSPPMMAAPASLKPSEIARVTPPPAFVCFYAGSRTDPERVDERMLNQIAKTLTAVQKERAAFQRRPGFVVYAPEISHSWRTNLAFLGAIVLTRHDLPGKLPTDAESFEGLFRAGLERWSHPRIRGGWREPRHPEDNPARARLPIGSVLPEEPRLSPPSDARYAALLRQLKSASPEAEY